MQCIFMRKFADGWLGRVRIGTGMTVLMTSWTSTSKPV